MEKKTKQNLLIIVVGVGLFAVLMNLNVILQFVNSVINIILPIIAGGILALFINVPMTGIEKLLRKMLIKRKKQPSDNFYRRTSFILTFICIIFVLTLVFTLLIPELVSSMKGLYLLVEAHLPQWIDYLENINPDSEWLEEFLADVDLENIVKNISNAIDSLVVNAVESLSSTVNIVVTAAFAIIISIYMSLEKNGLCRHAKKLTCAYLKPIYADNILKFCRLFRQSFSKFLTGQCSEAIILGVLMSLAFAIFKIPYGSLVGVLTAICAIIPYVGAFISCSISVFLVLLIDPMLAVRCLIVYLVVQFIENQFIYPRVVGSSVGLSPLYTLIAAMIGGKLFGIIGIIFFIPLTAVIIELVKEDAERRLHKKQEDNEKHIKTIY